jgi:hypothetical protein
MTHFPAYFAVFFGRNAAAACKNLFCLAKNGHFFVSDATTQPVPELISNHSILDLV